jgi:prolipoprotein diacylglyceryltransferase/protein-S-isoprenylcysteine O-methyltransferase Ste14
MAVKVVPVFGKLAYGALFLVVLPLLLLAWAGSTADVVRLLALHSPIAGAALFAAGLIVMAAGMAALAVHGGGLPMNAFPPPRYVNRGIYALVPHPIYFGFTCSVAGAAMAAGSASGLWLVAPLVALGCAALVIGYERPDLERRLGPSLPRSLFSLPREADEAPPFAERLSVLFTVLLPWLLAYEAVVFLGLPRDAVSAVLPFEAHWPVVEWTEILYASAYLFVPLAPLVARKGRDLRAFAVGGLLATAIGVLIFLTVPLIAPPRSFIPSSPVGRFLAWERTVDSAGAAFPSFHVLWALLSARLWARSYPRWRAFVWSWGVAVGVSCLTTGMHALVDVIAGAVLFLVVANPPRTWGAVRRWSERLANSWREWSIGGVRLLNGGFLIGVGAFVGVALAGYLAGGEGAGPILTVSVCGLVGAGLWAQLVEGSSRLARPFGYYGGVGGVILGTVAVAIAGGDGWLLAGAFSVAAPWIQGVGRLRCLVNGCCHGRVAPETVGIRYLHPRTRPCRLADLADVPIHPTQTYSILWNLACAPLLLRLWIVGTPPAFVGGLYLILNGLGRFGEEAYRGEPQTPEILGLHLYQWTALCSVLAGGLLTAIGPRGIAPAAEWNGASFTIAALFGLLAGCSMGVDFPRSDRRFARLA